jgi:predicted GNAT family acetyltransferase
MAITCQPSAAAFLAATEAFRGADPYLTNIMGSVARGVVDGRAYASELWLTVHDESGAVIGMAMRTAPWNMAVSAMPAEAAEELGRLIARIDADVPGVNGPPDVVDAVVAGLAPPAGRGPRIAMVDVLRVLTTLRPPTTTSGAAVAARPEDVPLLIEWHHAFADDAGLAAHSIEDSVRKQVSDEAVWIWEDGGMPVAMAGHAPLVDTPGGTVARIGPVYTPAHLRGRGYASAVTAAVTAQLLPQCRGVMLFADAQKPAVNRLYDRLGFAEVTRIVEVSLDA